MVNLKGTKTAENLMASFAGESQARMRYTYYANVAKKEGFVQISNIFSETADNEMAHAKRFLDLLNRDLSFQSVEIKASYPVALGNTVQNLKSAAEGENEEHSTIYPEFARVAEDEGFPEIAKVFCEISKAEMRHEARFVKLYSNIEANLVFNNESPVEWKCNNCGYVHLGVSAPELCPACNHAKGYFELFKETY